MVVRTNVMSLNSHRNLKTVGSQQAKSSSRLSSGYRINSAADDAAGLAISEKMRAQIRGLDQASTNAQDAISLIQTAEGGMQEIDNMVQRIRELVVKAANDTNDQSIGSTKDQGDRQKIQDEIDQLIAEIDSMSSRVEFNNKKLIDGSFSDGSVADLDSVAALGSHCATGRTAEEIALSKVKQLLTDSDFLDLTAAAASSDYVGSGATELGAFLNGIGQLANVTTGTIKTSALWESLTNGSTGALLSALQAESAVSGIYHDDEMKAAIDSIVDKLTDIYDELNNGIDLDEITNGLTGNFQTIGTSATALGTNAEWAAVAALTSGVDDVQAAMAKLTGAHTTKIGLQNDLNDLAKALREASKNLDPVTHATSKTAIDNLLTAITPPNGNTVTTLGQLLADKLDAINEAETAKANSGQSMYFQIGANSHQGLSMNINSVSSKALGLGDGSGNSHINVVTATGADITCFLDGLDKSLTFVTTERSKLGAAQNRLEYTMRSLDISSENLSASESRIRDTDMAKEMMNLTQANVLQSAATSMLAQANMAPQSILQLLQ